jgi:sugar O-acyltransferase (sialic acid O-acetyltransferase NeuD family)
MRESMREPLLGVILLGGGGHARVILDCLLAQGVTIAGILDHDGAKQGQSLLGIPVLGDDQLLDELAERGVTRFVVGLGGARDNAPRQRLYERAMSVGLRPLTVRHPSALVSPHAHIEEGAQLLPGSIVNAGAVIGTNVIVNSGAIVEHDCIIEPHVHIATGARLAAAVRVGMGAHVGAGATIKQGVEIAAAAVVGAGAVVLRNVAKGTVVVGVPARPLDGNRGGGQSCP